MKRIRSILSKLDKQYVVCPLAVWAALGVLASFTGHWPTEENPYRSYALQACAWLEGRLDLGQDYMALNAARFGNPLEFGHSYLPEFVRAEEGQFSLSYAAKHFAQLLRLPKAGGEHGMLVYDPYDCMAFWLIAPMTISFFAAWLAALAGRRKGRALELFALPLMLAAHLMIICCHRTLGGYQFGNRYIVDMLPYIFYGLLSLKTENGADWNIPLFALGFSVNLIGTVAAYNHWI